MFTQLVSSKDEISDSTFSYKLLFFLPYLVVSLKCLVLPGVKQFCGKSEILQMSLLKFYVIYLLAGKL